MSVLITSDNSLLNIFFPTEGGTFYTVNLTAVTWAKDMNVWFMGVYTPYILKK